MITNWPITKKVDLLRSEDILGSNLGSLNSNYKDKAIKSRNEHMQ